MNKRSRTSPLARRSLGSTPPAPPPAAPRNLPPGVAAYRYVSGKEKLRVVDELSRKEFVVTAGDPRRFFMKTARAQYLGQIGYTLRVVA